MASRLHRVKDRQVACADLPESAESRPWSASTCHPISHCLQRPSRRRYVDIARFTPRDHTDTTKFTASFNATLGYLLASYLAGPIVKGSEGLKLGDGMRQRAMSLAALAATANANASSQRTEFTPAQLRTRA